MEKEFRMEHSQVPLSLLVTNLTAVTTFILRSLIFIMFDYRNGRRLRSCLLFFPTSVGDYYSGMLLRCGGRKMAPSTPIKKKVLPLHVDMSRNKKRTKPYYRSFFLITKNRCPADISDTHSHTFIAISKHSQKRWGVATVSTLFPRNWNSIQIILVTPNSTKKKTSFRVGHYHTLTLQVGANGQS